MTEKAIQWQKTCENYFKTLDALQKAVFVNLMENNSHENEIRQIRLTLFNVMKQLRAFTHPNAPEKIAAFESLYEIIFSLNTLKPHLSDLAIREICQREFKNISEQLSYALKNQTADSLPGQMDALDELYHTTLQVVSKEPIFFLFFIKNLVAFCDTLDTFFQKNPHA
ncbi:MAG TPA: hypothetical protein VLJ15_05610 [Gammaproteobacteria bacterium]|nr:hypothetical protein [Gammaproteobacteria bacterium]